MKKKAPIKNDGVFYEDVRRILAEARRQTYMVINFAMVAFPDFEKSYALRRELAWTHIRLAMCVENPAVRLADSRGGLVCPPKVTTASSRCNAARRQGCRRHLRAESPFASQKHSFVMCWNVLKTRLKSKGNETVTNCHQLKWEAVSFK